MHWLCVFLPQLALDDVLRRLDDPLAPVALVSGPRQRRVLHAVNAAAREAGLRPGLTMAAAQALGVRFRSADHDPDAAERCRRLVAAWAYGYSSQVSLDLPHAVLLEIGRSRRLFGGWAQLAPRLSAELQDMHLRHRLVAAPNPWAARLLANVHASLAVDAQTLPAALDALPVARSGLAGEVRKALARMGLRRLGELRRLPRASIGRRFASTVLDHLDRAYGLRPEPLIAYRPPDVFEARIEFDHEVESSQALLFPLRRLTADLAAFLRSRDGGVQRFVIRLEHEREGDSDVVVGLLAPEREAGALFDLARARIERAQVPAPVRGMRLRADDLPRFVPDAGDLFASQARPQLPWLQLRERLRARLGDAAVRPVAWRADHRPECILLDGPPVDPRIRAVPRPGWLLPTPTACRERIERLVAGPERIESGWWDDGDVRRDYYVAETVDGRRIWLFREAGDLAGDGPVCVHGLFG